MHRLNRRKYGQPTLILLLVLLTAGFTDTYAQNGRYDTLTTYAVVYNGDTIEAKTLYNFAVYARIANANMANRAKMTRLRNAIIVTYPYALRSGLILNEMNARLATVTDKKSRKEYIKTREKELKKEFTDPLSNLSIYQGKVLMKLINRQTGNNCYNIIKEYKGGFTARFYQTVAFFFSSNLKQDYDPRGDDIEIEMILKEVCRTYGFNYYVSSPSVSD
jgi:CRISPR/Cas system-associated protein endoribonuclease Cas2